MLFGGTLMRDLAAHQRDVRDYSFEELFDHAHDVSLEQGGLLAASTGLQRLTVNSVHEQGIDRLGGGLTVEATAVDDGLVEAFSANPCGAPVVAVQWHPEWNGAASAESRAFFQLIGDALRRESEQAALAPGRRRTA